MERKNSIYAYICSYIPSGLLVVQKEEYALKNSTFV